MVEKYPLVLGVLGGMVIACPPSRDASSPVPAAAADSAAPVASSPPPTASPPDEPAASLAPPAVSSPPAPGAVPADVAKLVAFIDGLPTCAPHGAELSVEEALTRLGSSQIQSIRGRLVPRTNDCTEMDCGDDCCNVCGGAWTLASANGLQRVTLPMHWDVRECDRGAMTARLGAGADVVATGRLREAPQRRGSVQVQLTDAHLCVLRAAR